VVLATLARPIGGWLADRIGGSRTLVIVFAIVPLTALVMSLQPELGLFRLAVLTTAVLLGIGNGAVFKLVAAYYPDKTGAVTGVVGAAGGLGGFSRRWSSAWCATRQAPTLWGSSSWRSSRPVACSSTCSTSAGIPRGLQVQLRKEG
jgi:nitrate/nitrite transporter NarK